MHFYCFLPFCQRISRISRIFCLYHLMNRMNLMAGAMQCLVKSGASGDYLFFCAICVICWPFVAHPGARTWCHALPWWAFSLLAILTDRSSQKKYLDYDYMFPPMESNHRKAMPGTGWGRVISSFSLPRNSISDHAARCRVLNTSRAAPRMSLLSTHSSRLRNAHCWVSCWAVVHSDYCAFLPIRSILQYISFYPWCSKNYVFYNRMI